MNIWYWLPVGVLLGFFVASIYKRIKMLRNLEDTPDSDKVHVLTDANFRKTIKNGVSLVDFWAPWCMPCKIQGPIVNEVAEQMHDQAQICKINIEDHKKVAQELGIRSIPTIIIFRDGKPVQTLVGAKQKGVLIKAVKQALEG